jgi:hypothetical protein
MYVFTEIVRKHRVNFTFTNFAADTTVNSYQVSNRSLVLAKNFKVQDIKMLETVPVIQMTPVFERNEQFFRLLYSNL